MRISDGSPKRVASIVIQRHGNSDPVVQRSAQWNARDREPFRDCDFVALHIIVCVFVHLGEHDCDSIVLSNHHRVSAALATSRDVSLSECDDVRERHCDSRQFCFNQRLKIGQQVGLN